MARNQSSRLHLKIIRTFFHDSKNASRADPKPTNAASPPALAHPAVALAPSTPMTLGRGVAIRPCIASTSSVEQLNSITGDLIDGALPAFTFATSSTHGALRLACAGTEQPEKRSVFRRVR
jgi:hypothetical protein